MVTEQQVVVNVEGPTVAGEGARTFFRQHSHVCPEMPLMAGERSSGGHGFQVSAGAGSGNPSTRGQPPRAAGRPALHSRTLRTFPTAAALTTSGCAGCACCALCRAEGLR